MAKDSDAPSAELLETQSRVKSLEASEENWRTETDRLQKSVSDIIHQFKAGAERIMHLTTRMKTSPAPETVEEASASLAKLADDLMSIEVDLEAAIAAAHGFPG